MATPNPFENLLEQTDIWTGKILLFLGPGHFLFIASVNHRLKELYQEYFSKLEEIPRAQKRISPFPFETFPASLSTTFFRVAFSSLSCAEFWLECHGLQSLLHSNQVCGLVAKSGNLSVLKWARHEKGYQWGPLTCAAAAGAGHLELLQWLHENGCPWSQQTCMEAARGGHLEVLKWAHENGCPWDEWVCSYAAKGGHLEVLKWLRENGCPWLFGVCAEAATEGHLEVLKWAHENGCPWNKWVCAYAAKRGHLNVLQWAHENGCPWDEHTCLFAAERGHATGECRYRVN
jgi:hypothetical protein